MAAANTIGMTDSYDAWDIAPVVNPSLPANRRQRMIRRSRATTPAGRPVPMRQVLHRDISYAPSLHDAERA
jgi:hypothetical protein